MKVHQNPGQKIKYNSYSPNIRYIEAIQWNKVGDHPLIEAVSPETVRYLTKGYYTKGGCSCNHTWEEHGTLIKKGGIDVTVCPGDYVRKKGKYVWRR